jgi:hypothetical protein
MAGDTRRFIHRLGLRLQLTGELKQPIGSGSPVK